MDLSATPYYLSRTGNDPGRPFEWVVSDFGLVDAIESGLVKIPQLPVKDTTGEEIPAYFNVWKWIIEKQMTRGEKGARRGEMSMNAVLKYAQHPIAQLAGLWRDNFLIWQEEKRSVPPVFIVVCANTKLAKLMYEWIALGKSDSHPPISEFLNRDSKEYTIRVDSKVVGETNFPHAKEKEILRLRTMLNTVGKIEWKGGRPPEDWLQLATELQLDPMIPPGRDIRCIISVAMLTEGWDANTVTHIIGLRPFESQLLCEQVVGRGLRRSQYHDLSVEEVAKVYGVPFEIIPLKVNPTGPQPPPAKTNHVHAVSPERDLLEITFPRVDGYVFQIQERVKVKWDEVPPITLDPGKIPPEVVTKALSGAYGDRLTIYGPGKTDVDTLDSWRKTHRLQELEFELAATLTKFYVRNLSIKAPANRLFPQLLSVVKEFLKKRVTADPGTDVRDVFLNPYYVWVIEILTHAIRPDTESGEAPELPRYELNRRPGSTKDVDFWTAKKVIEVQKSHLNFSVADTQKWEQIAGYYLDRHDNVYSFARNFNLGFTIPYIYKGERKEYIPDFLVKVKKGEQIVGTAILEVKGYDELEEVKTTAARRWVSAVNADGQYGKWVYHIIHDPVDAAPVLSDAARELS